MSWAVNVMATLLLAHGMIIAAYMIHECGHNMVFNHSRHNAYLGTLHELACAALLTARTRTCATSIFGTMSIMTMSSGSTTTGFSARHPFLTRVTRVLEWFYIPAHDLIMHGVMVLTSFVIPQRRDQRMRNVAVILVRGGIFVALLIVAPKVALLYVLAYLIMMHVLRFMDSVQHDYGYNTTLFEYVKPPHKGDTEWEQRHTFSNPHQSALSQAELAGPQFRLPQRTSCKDMNMPFYRLPELHRELDRQ